MPLWRSPSWSLPLPLPSQHAGSDLPGAADAVTAIIKILSGSPGRPPALCTPAQLCGHQARLKSHCALVDSQWLLFHDHEPPRASGVVECPSFPSTQTHSLYYGVCLPGMAVCKAQEPFNRVAILPKFGSYSGSLTQQAIFTAIRSIRMAFLGQADRLFPPLKEKSEKPRMIRKSHPHEECLTAPRRSRSIANAARVPV